MWCWYHGAPFRGYQAQASGPTVQATLVEALRAAGFERNPVASGRTDAGVHARMQVLSMRLTDDMPLDTVAARINAQLPPSMGIGAVREAPPHFNAHWKATEKEYRYRLARCPVPAWAEVAWEVSPDRALLTEALELTRGTHDFFAFHDKSSPVRPRTITHIEVVEAGALLEVRLRGAGFGRYMVRYLVAGAVAVATGTWSLEGFRQALQRGATADRPAELVRAPAHPLILWNVSYPAADDPFSAADRREAQGVPSGPPFCDV